MFTDALGLYLSLTAGFILCTVFFSLSLKQKNLPVRIGLIGSAAGLFVAFLCGKLLWLVFNTWVIAKDGMIGLVRFDPTEFSFIGTCAGFCLGVWLTARLSCLSLRTAPVLDCLALPGTLFVAVARFGQLFYESLGVAEFSSFGLSNPKPGSLFTRFPFAMEDDFGFPYLGLVFYEAVLILIVALFLYLHHKKHEEAFDTHGGLFFEHTAYVLCALELFLELRRFTSPVFLYVHTEQAFAAVIMLILLIRFRVHHAGGPVLPIIFFVLMLVVNGLTQFYMDKPWNLAKILPEAVFRFFTSNLFWITFILLLLTPVLSLLVWLVPLRRLLTRRKST